MCVVKFADIGLSLDQMTKSQATKLKLHASDSPAKTGIGASLKREWTEVLQSWNSRAQCSHGMICMFDFAIRTFLFSHFPSKDGDSARMGCTFLTIGSRHVAIAWVLAGGGLL